MKNIKYWTRERIASACERMGSANLAEAVRDKGISIQACRSYMLVAVERGADGEWLYDVDTHIRSASNLRDAQKTLDAIAENVKIITRLVRAKGRVHGSLYVYEKIGSGRWTRYGSRSVLSATGWAKLVGAWLVVYNGRGRKAEEIKRVKLDGGSFARFEFHR